MKIFPSASSRSNPDTSFSDNSIVIYENNNNIVLGAITGSKKDKFRVLNQKCSEIELAANRLYPLPGKVPVTLQTQKEKAAYLDDLFESAHKTAPSVELSTIWESFEGLESEVSTEAITDLFYGNNEVLNHLAARIALLNDTVYFKRKKDTFTARTKEAVESLLKEKEAEAVKDQQLRDLVLSIQEKIKDPSYKLPNNSAHTVSLIEDLAAGVTEGQDSKEARDLLSFLLEELNLNISGRPEEKAFSLLEKIEIFNESTNLSIIKYRPRISFSEEALDEATKIAKSDDFTKDTTRKDLTNLFTVTIDDITTKDMDDALSIERTETGYVLGIHISDVAALLNIGSILEREAKTRGTSIYCPELTINMLPTSLSQARLSLREGELSPVVSYMITLNEDFDIVSYEIFSGIIKVKSRLDYEQVDQVLANPSEATNLSVSSQALEKLQLLLEVSNKLEVDRIDNGAVRVNRKDVSVIVEEDSPLKLSEFDEASPARSLVGEMMIIANHLTAEFCNKNKIPCIYRTQPDSDVDPFSNPNNVPDGPALDLVIRMRLKRSSMTVDPGKHSSLGLSFYTQATSPIRRYLDLCVQRQISSYINTGECFYSTSELNDAIIESETPLTNAKYLSQESKRFWLLKYLQQEQKNSPTIGATIIRTDLKNPIAQLDIVYLTLPIHLQRSVTLGEHLTLKIVAIDPRRDFIRFEEAI